MQTGITVVSFLKRIPSFGITLLLLFTLCGCQTQAERETPLPADVTATVQPAAEEPASVTSTLLVAGDAMSHMPQTYDALSCGNGEAYDYTPCLQYVKPWIQSADYSVCNLETVFRSGKGYSGFPCFNSPGSFAYALKDAGFDLVTTANNHCMDQGYAGLCDTLDTLDELGLAHIGTYRTKAEFDAHRGVAVANVGGITVAFLDYTYGTNGIPVSSQVPSSVNVFHTDYLTTLSSPDTGKLIGDLEYAGSLEPDLIAVLIHWGVEYQTKENSEQEQLADLLIANGADLVLGGHPHVPQPMGYREVTLEDGSTRKGFVCYSLGNLVSSQDWRYADTTALLRLTLTKDLNTGDTVLEKVSYIPCLVVKRDSSETPRFLILDAYRAMVEYEQGTNEYLTSGIYTRLQSAVADCALIFGAQFDCTCQ